MTKKIDRVAQAQKDLQTALKSMNALNKSIIKKTSFEPTDPRLKLQPFRFLDMTVSALTYHNERFPTDKLNEALK